MLEVRLLGKFEAKSDGKPVAIPSRPAQSLFAYLILSAGTSHRREKLAGLLWPDSLEETARDNLRHLLWRVRKAIPSPGDYLVADDLAIAFNASSEYWLDAAQLEKLSDDTSADELMVVLSAYQGELLPGFYDEWVVLEREHLYSIFEHHMARLMSLLQEERRWLEILDWGERWIKLGQKPEPAYRALMTAHAAKGDMSKVAAAYKRCVKSLKEFGVGPSEQTRALYERLKSGKEIIETGLAIRVKEKHEESPKTNLPIPLTSFIGREKEIEDIVRLLSKHRLVTLTGPGGVGKTRLAIQSSNELLVIFKDGVWWVEFAPLTDGALVPQVVAQVLDVRESPSQPLIESLKNFLHGKESLLVLDNCEHLIAPSAQLAFDLLSHCANLRILTTSREALGITGENLYLVPTLSFPRIKSLTLTGLLLEYESIRLFVERASAVKPDFALTEQNGAAVLQICQRLEGISLALELAAARTKLLTVEQIADRLNDRFNLLTQGSRTALPRHQTLRAAIDWSHYLLAEPEQVLFRRLAIFAGGFTVEAAELVTAGGDVSKSQIPDLLEQLIDKSLITVRAGLEDSETRYGMLETIREYAYEKLDESGETEQLRHFHRDYFIALTEHADKEIHGPEQVEWMDRIESEHDNLGAALDWCVSNQKTESALRLICALGFTWGIRGRYAEARGWFYKVRAMPRITDYPALHAKLLYHIGVHCSSVTDFASALPFLEESQAIWLDLGMEGERGLARCLRALGSVARWTNQGSAVAKSYFDRSFELCQKYEDDWGLAQSMYYLGIVASDQHKNESALSMFEKSAALYRQIGDLRGTAQVSDYLATMYLNVSNFEQARLFIDQALRLSEKLQSKTGIENALGLLGSLNRYQGRYRQAEEFYKRSLALCHEYGLKGDMGWNLQNLGLLALHQDDYSLARQYFTICYDLVSRIYEQESAYNLITGSAAVAGGTNQPERAAKLSGAAQTILKTIDYQYPPLDNAELERHIQIARAKLGERAFETLQAEGRAMTMEQAVEFALKEAK